MPAMLKLLYKNAARLLFLSLLLPLSVYANGLQLSEAQIKAAFLQNFTLFIYWPKENDNTPRQICILGDNPFANALETIVSEYNKNAAHARLIRYLDSSAELDGCHVLYLDDKAASSEQEILAVSRPLLTVSSIEGFAQRGGMIEFYRQGNKMRFYINLDAIAQAGLKADANLLRVATLIRVE
jgi:hypothetical protein